MIEPADGGRLLRLLEKALANPARYMEMTFCAPFVDEVILPRLVQTAVAAKKHSCGFCVITSRDAAEALKKTLPGPAVHWRDSVVVRNRLHAKAYLLEGRNPLSTEAMITSANLTQGGTGGNIELGVEARASSRSGQLLIGIVRDFLRNTIRSNRSF